MTLHYTHNTLRLNAIIAILSHTNSTDRGHFLPAVLSLQRCAAQSAGKVLESVRFFCHEILQLVTQCRCHVNMYRFCAFSLQHQQQLCQHCNLRAPAVRSQQYQRCSRNFTSHLFRCQCCLFIPSFFSARFCSVILHLLMVGSEHGAMYCSRVSPPVLHEADNVSRVCAYSINKNLSRYM